MSAPVKGGNVELSGTSASGSSQDDPPGLGKAYDEFPYEGFPYHLTHPERLAVVGTLFSMRPPPPETARVLELGCGNGGNLIPMAYSLPKSQLVGYDLSKVHVQQANATISALDLSNVRIEQRDILDIPVPRKKFDYILCHGVFSWVPENVQTKILSLCRDALSENGVALVSYNTYPGWHMRESMRHMMRYHTRQFEDAKTKVAQARALLDFLSGSVNQKDSAYGMYLASELNILANVRDSYVAHEHLERWNQPMYFHEFVERATKLDLQYLGESEFSSMIVRNFPQRVAEKLAEGVHDLLAVEQYMDFLRNRTFRSTLLCHASQKLNRNIGTDVLSNLHAAAVVRPSDVNADLVSTNSAQFVTPTGVQFGTGSPDTKVALRILSGEWPRSIPVPALLVRTRDKMAEIGKHEAAESVLAMDLLQLFAANAIELHGIALPLAASISDKPATSALVRLQAAQGHLVTNLRHESAKVSEVERRILTFLDGIRRQDEIVDELVATVTRGETELKRDGQPITDRTEMRVEVERFFRGALPALAGKALLVA